MLFYSTQALSGSYLKTISNISPGKSQDITDKRKRLDLVLFSFLYGWFVDRTAFDLALAYLHE